MDEIRPLRLTDLGAALQLSTLAGWNQTAADWRTLLDLDAAGCFTIDGVATATLLRYDSRLAWCGPYLERSLHVRPDRIPRVHALLGRVLARTGHPQDAIRELTLGLASDEDGSVHYQLARLYQETGDTRAASAEFEKSRRIRAKRGVQPAAKEPDQ